MTKQRTQDSTIAVVTGAGRRQGIGAATAMMLAEQGRAVVAVERSAKNLTDEERGAGWQGAASVAEQIRAAGGVAWHRECDLRDVGQVQSLADFVAGHGPVGIVVNNAGTAGEASA